MVNTEYWSILYMFCNNRKYQFYSKNVFYDLYYTWMNTTQASAPVQIHAITPDSSFSVNPSPLKSADILIFITTS